MLCQGEMKATCVLASLYMRMSTWLALSLSRLVATALILAYWNDPPVFACTGVVSQAIRILGGGAEIRMVTIASFLEIIAKDFRNSAHGMSRA